MNFNEWLDIGMTNRWCGPAVCYTHDGMPATIDELEAFETDDPCINIIRLYEDSEHAEQIEENHAPSTWRKQ